MTKVFLVLTLILVTSATASATTWYVRTDGGTTTQCTGQTDAAYPGGSGQPCAYANPQDAINAATWGDTIMVRGGDTFNTTAFTPFSLTNKGTPPTGTDADYITLTTNPANIPAQLSQYPAVKTRITTAMAANMPKFRAIDGYPVFEFRNNSKYWKLEGLDLAGVPPTGQTVTLIGQFITDPPLTSPTGLPNKIIIQKCWMHPIEETGTDMNDSNFVRSTENAIYLNATNILIQNNSFQGFTGIGQPGYQPSRNGSLTQIESAANSGSVELNMPGEQWGTLVVGVAGRKSDTANYFSGGTVTFGGVPLQVGAAADSDPSKTQVCLFWSRVGLLGTQTLAWDWAGTGAPDEGVKIVYGFYSSTWTVRDAQTSSQQAAPPFATGTLDVAPDDLIIAFAGAGASADVSAPSWSNVTAVQTFGTRFNTTVAAWAEGDQESDVAVSTGAWTNAQSGAVCALVMRSGYRLDGKAVLITNYSDNYVIQNNLLEAWGNNVFTGGSILWPTGSSTIATATLTSATLADASGLNVGDIIGVNVTALGSGVWGNTIVATKNGNDITYEELVHSYDGNTHQQFTGHNVPAAGDKVQWAGYQPKNLVMRRNLFLKQPSAVPYLNGYISGKGFMELKACEDCIVEGNVFDDAPTGLVLTARNQNGSSPWGNLDRLIVRNNYWKQTLAPMPLFMRDGAFLSKKSVDVLITNNLFVGATTSHWFSAPPFCGGITAMTGCTITHNTILARGNAFTSYNYTEPYVDDSYTYTVTGFVMKDNIFRLGAYVNQFYLDGAGSSPTVNWLSAVVNTNVLIDDGFTYDSSYIDTQWLNYFPSNTEVNSLASVGWTSYDAGLTAAGNYRLSPSSSYRGAGSDGKDIGVDFDALVAGLGFDPWATTWFVRTDGGTTSQCTGHVDAAYPGSGTGQPCAYAALADAISASVCGDDIRLKAGQTFDTSSGWELPNKSCGSGTPITITSTDYTSLPAGRVGAADASAMPRLRATTDSAGIFRFAANASYWILDGLELTDNVSGPGHLAFLIDGSTTTANNITVKRSYLHQKGSGNGGSPNWRRYVTQAIQWEGGRLDFKWNHCPDWSGYYNDDVTLDTWKIILCIRCQGPLNVIDNFLEGAYVSIFTGGGGGAAAHTATLTSPTTTTATFSSTSSLSVGQVVYVLTTGTGTLTNGTTLTRTAGDTISSSMPTAGGFGRGMQLTPTGGGTTYSVRLTAANDPTLTIANEQSAPNGDYNYKIFCAVRIDQINGSDITYHAYGPDGIVQAPSSPGGAGWSTGDEAIPHDILVQKNTISAPVTFLHQDYLANSRAPKGYVEFKNGIRVTFDGNYFTGYPSTIGLTAKNQSGFCPWDRISDLVITNNWFAPSYLSDTGVIRSALLFSMNDPYHSTQPSSNYQISNNLASAGVQNFIQSDGGKNWDVYHNTVINGLGGAGYNTFVTSTSSQASAPDNEQDDFTLRDNIGSHLLYGISEIGGSAWTTRAIDHNVAVDTESQGINQNSWGTASILTPIKTAFSQVGFVDLAGKNFRLSGGSSFKGAGTGGSDPGIDQNALEAALGFSLTGGGAPGSGVRGSVKLKGGTLIR